LDSGFSVWGVADNLGENKSPIHREINRNSGQRGYHAEQGNKMVRKRKDAAKALEIRPELSAGLKRSYAWNGVQSRYQGAFILVFDGKARSTTNVVMARVREVKSRTSFA